MTRVRVVRAVRLAMVIAILLAVAGAVLAIAGGTWAAAAPALAVIPMCSLVLLLTYQDPAGAGRTGRRR